MLAFFKKQFDNTVNILSKLTLSDIKYPALFTTVLGLTILLGGIPAIGSSWLVAGMVSGAVFISSTLLLHKNNTLIPSYKQPSIDKENFSSGIYDDSDNARSLIFSKPIVNPEVKRNQDLYQFFVIGKKLDEEQLQEVEQLLQVGANPNVTIQLNYVPFSFS